MSAKRKPVSAREIGQRATEVYRALTQKYKASGLPLNFDFREHSAGWTLRGDHFTHRLHRYPGRLTPCIPWFFLSVDDVAVTHGRLLDPFAGCGTVLVEAPVHPVHPMNPVGFEINPLARLIAKVKTTPIERRAVLDSWNRIVARYRFDTSRAGLPSFPNKRHWLTESVERRLARVIRSLDAVRDSDLRDFFLVATSSVVRQVALADPSVSVPVKLDPTRFKDAEIRRQVRAELKGRQKADVLGILDRAVAHHVERLASWSNASTLSRGAATIVGDDARTFARMPYVAEGHLGKAWGELSAVDLVLTSPPYANAQRYTRSLRLELFVLGYTADGEDESALDRLQIGTERVHKREWEKHVERTGSSTADRTVEKISRRDEYRAAIVGKYVRDMKTVVDNCYRALKPGGHAVLVVGNNCVRGCVLDNAAIMTELGEDAGFEQRLRVRNRIPSRALLTDRHPTAGVITHEHVLVLQKAAASRP